jgi:hypothetical protein
MAQEWCAVSSCSRYRDMRMLPVTNGNERRIRLCTSCLGGLRANIVRLPRLFHDCEELLSNRRARGLERIRGGGPSGGVTLNESIVGARSDMLAVLASWAGLIVDERPVYIRPRRTTGELSRFLLEHLRWLAGHPAAADAATEIADVVRTAEELTSVRPASRLELGTCGEAGCGGMVTASVGPAADPSSIGCDRGHAWRPNEWLLLARRLERAQRAYSGGPSEDGDFAA